jgi:hypothetical protein
LGGVSIWIAISIFSRRRSQKVENFIARGGENP